MRLSDLKTGEKGVVIKVLGHGGFRKRIIEMGFIKGKTVEVIRNAPLKDPIEYQILGSKIALHRQEASMIEVIGEHENIVNSTTNAPLNVYTEMKESDMQEFASRQHKIIQVALVGNPNCGKTSLFNALSGSHAHVGNYSGVTIDAQEVTFDFEGYTFKMADLPGTYSLSAYSPEEKYVRKYITENTPDIIINVIDAANLERNLYLTTQLVDMNVKMIVALNMYDELDKTGSKLNYIQLSKLLGMPMVPTIARNGAGLEHMLHLAITVYEKGDFIGKGNDLNPAILRELKDWHRGNSSILSCKATVSCSSNDCGGCPSKVNINLKQIYHHIHINHGLDIERKIILLREKIAKNESLSYKYSPRYLAIKLLEKDPEIESIILKFPDGESILKLRNKLADQISDIFDEDSESVIADAKYAFINGALKETFIENTVKRKNLTEIIDNIVTHRIWGYPIFLLFLFIMFQSTFALGAYPQEWIESFIGGLGTFVSQTLPEGVIRDLLVDAVLGGVGSVLVFLPNILILYFFISLMEDSGYMARAAFMMDRLMHVMGLHGRSFIPLIMGFGCTVPAVMATRTIEDKKNRFITILITPFMSCTARLPIYILLIGAFFTSYAGIVLFSLYLFGILMAVLVASILSRTLLKGDDIPFVIELPPYRMPTLKAISSHTWNKGFQYVKKLGGVILVASLVIWALGYFPRNEHLETESQRQENSYIGQIGKTIEPVMKPLGFDWKLSVGLISGVGAKELVVSTLGVLYTDDADVKNKTLADRIAISPVVALAYMVFVLLYFPCIAAFAAIRQETNWKWAVFAATYTTGLAWVCAFIINQFGYLLC